ncbi:MAG: FAD-binding oxidoreductase [Oscillospiraceae bacterium]
MKIEPIMPKYQSYLGDESRALGYAENIVFASDTNDICSAIKNASKNKILLTVQGARTGVVGGAVPHGGLVLNLSKMNNIINMSADRSSNSMRVQAGVTLGQIEAEANANGLFFPPNPTEQTATIGGIFASNATGSSSLLFGDSSKYVSSLEFVTLSGELWKIKRGEYFFNEDKCPLPNGKEIKIPVNLPHYSIMKYPEQGTDLIDFLAGSEANLGVVTELELRIFPLPSEMWGVVYFFSSLEQAIMFLKQLKIWKSSENNAHLMATEFFDEEALKLLSNARQTSITLKALPEFPPNTCIAVYTELCGDDSDELESALMQHLDFFTAVGGKEESTWAETGLSEIRRFRDMRHAVPELINEAICLDAEHLFTRCETDFSGCPEKFTEFLEMYYKSVEKLGLKGLVYGHILQNKMHLALLPQSAKQQEACENLVKLLAEQVVNESGYLITENGVGFLKRQLVKSFLHPEVAKLIDDIRLIFDTEMCMKNKENEE